MKEKIFMNIKKFFHKQSIQGFSFILPAVLVLVILLVYPVVISVFYSFTSKHLIKSNYSFVGFSNYVKILSDPNFYHAFFVSLKWVVFSLLGQILFGFTAALALNKIKFGQSVFRTLLIIAWAFPSIVIALAWKWILNGVSGFLPSFLVKIGICSVTPEFLSDGRTVFWTLVFINVWFGAPLIMVNVLSALQTVPKDQYEAAQIDGASSWQSFLYITFPHIKMVVGLLVVLRTIWVFNNFDMIYLLTGGGPAKLTETLPIYAYNVGWGLKQLGKSSAITVLLMIFLLIVCALYFKLLDKWEKEAK